MKARADKVKRKEARHLQRHMLMSQRKQAQQQRRDRERMLQRVVKDKQDKIERQKEEEVREKAQKCPEYRGVLISGVLLIHELGPYKSVLNIANFRGALIHNWVPTKVS